MAEHAVFRLNLKLHLRRDILKKQSFVPKDSWLGIRKRWYLRSCKAVELLSRNARNLAPYLRNVNIHPVDRITKRCCLGAVMNADNPTTSEWITLADQVLLKASAFLTYIAGVTPAKKIPGHACKDDENDASALKNYSTGW